MLVPKNVQYCTLNYERRQISKSCLQDLRMSNWGQYSQTFVSDIDICLPIPYEMLQLYKMYIRAVIVVCHK